MILSVDPGETNIGFCIFDVYPERRKANLRSMVKLNAQSELYHLLRVAEGLGDQIETVVCENYRIRPDENDPTKFNPRSRNPYGRSQGGAGMISSKDFWNEVKTIRVIGACEMFAQWVGAEFITQEPRILDMARKWCDFPVPKTGHIKDEISAYIHGAHYLMKKGIIGGVEDIIKFGQEAL